MWIFLKWNFPPFGFINYLHHTNPKTFYYFLTYIWTLSPTVKVRLYLNGGLVEMHTCDTFLCRIWSGRAAPYPPLTLKRGSIWTSPSKRTFFLWGAETQQNCSNTLLTFAYILLATLLFLCCISYLLLGILFVTGLVSSCHRTALASTATARVATPPKRTKSGKMRAK